MSERELASRLTHAACRFPVVTLTVPRRSGKPALVRAEFPDHGYVNLEHPPTREFARTDPEAFVAQFDGDGAAGAVFDGIRRAPYLDQVPAGDGLAPGTSVASVRPGHSTR